MFFVCKLPWLFDRIHVRSWTHRFEHGKSACTWIWRQLVVPSLERNPGFFLLNFSNCWLDLTCHLLHAPWTWIIFGEFGITKSNGPKIPKSVWSQGMSPNISAKTKSAHQRPRMPWFYPFWHIWTMALDLKGMLQSIIRRSNLVKRTLNSIACIWLHAVANQLNSQPGSGICLNILSNK